MTIAKGRPWGHPAPLGPGGVVVTDDAEARAVVERSRRAGCAIPPLGLLGGDLCRTLGGTGDRSRLRSEQAMTFPVDLGSVLLDGTPFWFVAHLVVRDRAWGRVFVAMNAQWYGQWNLGPRAHPDDGLLDTYTARLTVAERLKVRSRLPRGAHLPHPSIRGRRVPAASVEFPHWQRVWLDGVALGAARSLVIKVEPDALTVVV